MVSCPFPSLLKYNHIFGEPGLRTGMRKYRIFDIAIFDTLVVLLAAYLFSIINHLPFITNALFLLVLGIFIHRILCVRTTIDKFLFP